MVVLLESAVVGVGGMLLLLLLLDTVDRLRRLLEREPEYAVTVSLFLLDVRAMGVDPRARLGRDRVSVGVTVLSLLACEMREFLVCDGRSACSCSSQALRNSINAANNCIMSARMYIGSPHMIIFRALSRSSDTTWE